ncbi:MAG: hypothetical protein LHW59_10645 [Candidatus Cloacimonetes bacterium]|nr:hypothetical protein [Candidatus Cloacimonadota bacterium]
MPKQNTSHLKNNQPESKPPQKQVENIFSPELTTVPIKNISLRKNDKLLNEAIERAVVEEFKDCIKKKNLAYQELLADLEALLVENHGWVKLEDDSWYFHGINAVLPRVFIPQSFRTDKFEIEAFQNLKVADFAASLPSQAEMEKILSSQLPYEISSLQKVPYIWLFDKGEKAFSTFSLSQKSQSLDQKNHPTLKTYQYVNNPLIHSSVAGLANAFKSVVQQITTPYETPALTRQFASFVPSANSPSFPENIQTIRQSGDEFIVSPPSEFPDVNVLPVYRLSQWSPEDEPLSVEAVLLLWLKNKLKPRLLSIEADALHNDALYKYLQADWAEDSKLFEPVNKLQLSEQLCLKKFESGATVFSWRKDEALMAKTLADIKKDGLLIEMLQERLLHCDVLRADIHPALEERLLTNENRGHWDLWGENWPAGDEINIELSEAFYARNPKADIVAGGIIGIDFGTKSTTAVRSMSKQQDKPLRIGHSDYQKLTEKPEDYENPTVMRFIDWQSFKHAYKQRPGRPETKWEDLTISHSAANTLKESEDSDSFANFLSDLKQWAGRNKTCRLKEKKSGKTFTLPPFLQLEEGELDPIEAYAYYLGLHINNPAHGIYLRYELSYPVTFDREVLDRLLASFERGIKKSLPCSILNDAECMKNFYVRFGASEPAAYALCALQEFGLENDLDEDQQVFYGVFDFGGGTTDFDFGIYKEASEEEQDCGIDYVLTHFWSSGDEFLGGENLLQLIAYEVFKQNKAQLLQKNIVFARPLESEGSSFEGEEALVNDSHEAHLNMHQLMEKLRPLWEESKEREPGVSFDYLQAGRLKVNLFDKNGRQNPGIELDFAKEQLTSLIRNRIERGVSNFFLGV